MNIAVMVCFVIGILLNFVDSGLGVLFLSVPAGYGAAIAAIRFADGE